MTTDHIDHDDEPPLPVAEMQAFRRNITPPPALEERTLTRLRRHGLLPAPARTSAPWLRRAIAAAAIFGAGVALGGWAVQHDLLSFPEAPPARRIEQSAQALVDALASTPADDAEARDAALRSLGALTGQLVRLAPDLLATRPIPGGTILPVLSRPAEERLTWY